MLVNFLVAGSKWCLALWQAGPYLYSLKRDPRALLPCLSFLCCSKRASVGEDATVSLVVRNSSPAGSLRQCLPF